MRDLDSTSSPDDLDRPPLPFIAAGFTLYLLLLATLTHHSITSIVLP